tara:strand:+ start:2098 stop:2460 length:363 start_codon:yes stop_codon:yes gene_type:complete
MSSQLNIYIDKGTDFRLTIELFEDVDTNSDGIDDQFDQSLESAINYQFFGDLRKLYSTKRAAEFTFQQSNNDVTIVLDSAVSSQLTPGKYQYDVIMKKPTGELSKIVEGLAFVVSTITEV